jgi:predicted nucleic acid-binding protein
VRFWDASCVVPLVIEQQASHQAREVLAADTGQIVWWATPVECSSAIARLEREGYVAADDADVGRTRLASLRDTWDEVEPSEELRERATALLLRHPLRAADALQLAAALVWARNRPQLHIFVSFDDRLASAARREGFAVEGYRP